MSYRGSTSEVKTGSFCRVLVVFGNFWVYIIAWRLVILTDIYSHPSTQIRG
jgi:hypothetical protein